MLAIDHEMVSKAICAHYHFADWQDGWQYLSKMCNVGYFVPRPRIAALLSALSSELRTEDDQLDLFWSFLLESSTEHLFYDSNVYLPRRLKRVVREIHMALSPHAHGFARVISNHTAAALNPVEAQKACYAMLLGVFILRESYPELYSRIVYKTNGRRADLLLDLGGAISTHDNLTSRAESALGLIARWNLSELDVFFRRQELLDLLARLFGVSAEGQLQEYRDILNQILDAFVAS